MRSVIHRFVTALIEHGTWDINEAKKIQNLTSIRDAAWVKKHFVCVVCNNSILEGVINYNYMLTPEIWALAGFNPTDMAHISCVESRLKRELIQSDFQKCPMNALIHWIFQQGIELPKD